MDSYSKAMLIVIAAALVALVAQNVSKSAVAQNLQCGTSLQSPCAVQIANQAPIAVRVVSQP